MAKKRSSSEPPKTWREKVEGASDVKEILRLLKELKPKDPEYNAKLTAIYMACQESLLKKIGANEVANTTPQPTSRDTKRSAPPKRRSSFRYNDGTVKTPPRRSELDEIVDDLKQEATRDHDAPRSYHSFVDSDGPSARERLQRYIEDMGRDLDIPLGPQRGDGFL